MGIFSVHHIHHNDGASTEIPGEDMTEMFSQIYISTSKHPLSIPLCKTGILDEKKFSAFKPFFCQQQEDWVQEIVHQVWMGLCSECLFAELAIRIPFPLAKLIISE